MFRPRGAGAEAGSSVQYHHTAKPIGSPGVAGWSSGSGTAARTTRAGSCRKSVSVLVHQEA